MPVPSFPTVRSLLVDATRELGERIDAELLLSDALGRSRSWLFAHADDLVAADGVEAFAARVARRRTGEPIAYILGRRGFWSFELTVTPATLIPRPETELLVELALERLPRDRACRVVDLGTGSGAIALAIARERPLAEVVATDASTDALAVAEGNARTLGLDRVRFVRGDWFAPLSDGLFDLIVSNPPYIEADDRHLGEGDLRYEPVSALASGLDGLDDIRRIVAGAPAHLRPGGWLLLEHGWTQGSAVRTLFDARWQPATTQADLEGRERTTLARLSPD
ncbi:MAG TPA: peptide chain release factor N(5)-glutamine methyltransferase [Luteibacter sp.]|jgi:release factor glutamine methyltransferase|nr:peptide chain release factor N(5)-glutamine methyltransferase [Luteibacter sp.]